MSFSIDLTDKVAVVTGSSRGIGRAIARALAGAGADVVITSRNPDSLQRVKEDLETLGRRVLPVQLDVRKRNDIIDMAEAALDHFGHVDILVNNAGMNIRTPALKLEWEEWDAVLETNLKGAFFCAQAIAPNMIQRGWGRIINIGSATCVNAFPDITAYCASRGGTLQMTKSIAAVKATAAARPARVSTSWCTQASSNT